MITALEIIAHRTKFGWQACCPAMNLRCCGSNERAAREHLDQAIADKLARSAEPTTISCPRCSMPRPVDEPCRNCQREQQESAHFNRRY